MLEFIVHHAKIIIIHIESRYIIDVEEAIGMLSSFGNEHKRRVKSSLRSDTRVVIGQLARRQVK